MGKGNETEYTRKPEYGVPVRIGNWKVTLIRLMLGGDGKSLVPRGAVDEEKLTEQGWQGEDAVEISSAEETFSIRIPQSYTAFTLITDLVRRGTPDADSMLAVMFCNMAAACTVADGFYQNCLMFAGRAYLEHTDSRMPKKDKKLHYENLIKEFSACLHEDLKHYKEEKKRPDLSEEDYLKEETADMLLHDDTM